MELMASAGVVGLGKVIFFMAAIWTKRKFMSRLKNGLTSFFVCARKDSRTERKAASGVEHRADARKANVQRDSKSAEGRWIEFFRNGILQSLSQQQRGTHQRSRLVAG